MRYISWVHSAGDFGPPPQALMDAIAEAGARDAAKGILLDSGGIGTLDGGGANVTLTGGSVRVLDGPYSEAKELVGGYAIQKLNSREEAVASAKWLLELHKELWPEWEGEIEVRQLYGAEDF
ncbi:YciI family protein [Antrihabitans spumae]|uniref:YciI family protein n=1 Tax=Antrihabitans spumae TaxID=3373370 RepID=A0ABW7KIR2_9NOCA